MFTPIDLIPGNIKKEKNTFTKRWLNNEGKTANKNVIDIFSKGAGMNCLEGKLANGLMTDAHDLKGILIKDQTFKFKEKNFTDLSNDDITFFEIDFDYAVLVNVTFENARFVKSSFNFVTIKNCHFTGCIFEETIFQGAEIAQTEFKHCDFINGSKFYNCGFINTQFENMFIDYRIFYNSRFDETTQFNEIKDRIINAPQSGISLNKEHYSEMYKGLKEGYSNGDCREHQRKYYQLEMQSRTRYNSKTFFEKLVGYFLELFSGYGVKPARVLRNIFIIFCLFTVFFIAEYNFFDGLILSAGAYFTFGAQSGLLQGHNVLEVIYIFEAFLGITSIAFFITVLYNYFFGKS